MKQFCIATIIIVSLIAWGLPHQAAFAGTEPDFAVIDRYIQQQMQKDHIPGVSLAITAQDQIAHLRGFGVAGPSGRPMTAQTPMLIGSLSKSFTALGVLQLAETGLVDLDSPVQRYLPWFRIGPSTQPADGVDASSTITIRHLLNQTSGLSRLSGEKLVTIGNTSDTALENNVRALSLEHLDRSVGSSFEYSNANYVVLGMVHPGGLGPILRKLCAGAYFSTAGDAAQLHLERRGTAACDVRRLQPLVWLPGGIR